MHVAKLTKADWLFEWNHQILGLSFEMVIFENKHTECLFLNQAYAPVTGMHLVSQNHFCADVCMCMCVRVCVCVSAPRL